MADGKRRDKRGRVLRNGEVQQPDGRYRFLYYDGGKKKSFYSWRLEKTDKVPAGKRGGPSLREKESEYYRKVQLRVSIDGGGMTVLDLVKKYCSLRKNIKETTRTGYKTVINFLEKDDFGRRRIDTIKTMEAKEWLIRLQEGGRGYSSIHSIRGVLRPAFAMAVENDLILRNPFDFQLVDVIVNDSVRREAISRKDRDRFLEFVRLDKHFRKYYDAFYILFYTGMRISEFCGLTIYDIDMEARVIHVDHQLQRNSDMVYRIINSPKTDAGNRDLPMTDGTFAAFQRILKGRKGRKTEPMVDGRSGFLYFDKYGKPCVAMHWEKYFQHAWEKHNKIYKEELPPITPHVCRHTYCSIQARSGMPPKTLMYLMGHADIAVTLNVYTHLGLMEAKEDVEKLEKQAGKNGSATGA